MAIITPVMAPALTTKVMASALIVMETKLATTSNNIPTTIRAQQVIGARRWFDAMNTKMPTVASATPTIIRRAPILVSVMNDAVVPTAFSATKTTLRLPKSYY